MLQIQQIASSVKKLSVKNRNNLQRPVSMPGDYLYRLLRDDEDPDEGIKARKPEAVNVSVLSHVHGKKDSPYISTTATITAMHAYIKLSIIKKNKKKAKLEAVHVPQEPQSGMPYSVFIGASSPPKPEFQVIQINREELEKFQGVEIIDLSLAENRDKHLNESPRAKNYAAKYAEVLVRGFIPADLIEVMNYITPLLDADFDQRGYKISDYSNGSDDTEELTELTSGLSLN